MWIMTTDGFYSAVEHRNHPHLVIVRARVYDDLVNLVNAVLPGVQPESLIVDSPRADYPCRVTLNKAVWREYVAAAAEGIDYDNFKSAVSRRQGSDRSHVYHGVWAVLHRLEDDPIYEPSGAPVAPFGPSTSPLWAEPFGPDYDDEEDSYGSLHRVPLSRPLPLDT